MEREFDDFEKDVSWDVTLGEASPASGNGLHRELVGVSCSWGSRQVSKQVLQRSRTARPVHTQPVKYDWYERINKAAITTLLSTQEGGRKKNAIEQTFF